MTRIIMQNGITRKVTGSQPTGFLGKAQTVQTQVAQPRQLRSTVRARNGQVHGGAIVARNIPTRFARSGILARPSSQRFSAPEHASLLRID